MNPDELRAAADRIAFPSYPVTPEGRTQWDEDRYASVSAMKSLADVIKFAENVENPEDPFDFDGGGKYDIAQDILRLARGETSERRASS
ncbi:MAG: hypothetical protein ACTH7X_08975 [Brevibacterium aurantiacum]